MKFELDAKKNERRQPVLSQVCSLCVHFDDSKISQQRCKAFPKGIPDSIWSGENNHTEPYKGDNDIRFEKIDVANLAQI